MIRWFKLFIILFLCASCPEKDKAVTPSLSQDGEVDQQKSADFDRDMRAGNIAGAINRMTEAPCPNCTQEVERPSRRSNRAPIQMVAVVANEDCFERGKSRDLSKLEINLRGANRKERRYMEQFASTLIKISGEAQAKHLVGDLRVVFQRQLRTRNDGNCLPGHQLTPGEVNMARQCPDGARIEGSEGILVHEIGHYVANEGNWYPRYEQAVRTRCRVSRYCTHTSANNTIQHRREEFAEVFAAFLMSTDRLKRDCPESYEFLKKEMFNNSDYHCDSKPI